MSQLFSLTLTDNVNSVNFISNPTYYVMDGGFDIGTPGIRREFSEVRPGFFVPVVYDVEYREATLRFEIRGNTRTEVLNSLHKIEKILRNVSAQVRVSAGRRGELSYAWVGATNITYFEVYSGHIELPGDILSVEKMFVTDNGRVVLPDITLKLYLSGMGYGASIYSEATLELPLYNPSVGAKQTGGVTIKNPASGQYNYVEIDGADIPGSSPAITKIQLAYGSPYNRWVSTFIGLQQSPFSSKLLFPNADVTNFGLTWTSADAGVHKTTSWTGAYSNVLPACHVGLDNNTIGTFYAFYRAYNELSQSVQVSFGLWDSVYNGISSPGEYVGVTTSGRYSLPLGPIRLPQASPILGNYGNLAASMALWVAAEGTGTLSLAHISLLPITNGLRVWHVRGTPTDISLTFVDDHWKGLQYAKNGSNQVTTPFFGLMDAIKLEPGVTQRLYFTSLGISNSETELQRTFTARVYAVPTFSTLAY